MTARRSTRATTLLGLLLGSVVLASPAAAADASDDEVRSLDVDLTIESSGAVLVTETYEWDFGDREGRGFARDLVTAVEHDDGYRRYEYSDFSASSPSGAPAELEVLDHGASLEVQVAADEDSDERVSGVQTYVVSYRIDGALNAVRDEAGVPDADELYWNITGDDHVHMDVVDVTVEGPVAATAVRCTQASDGTTCDELSEPEQVVTARGTNIEDGDNLTLAVAYPAGTFDVTDPILLTEEEYADLTDDSLGGAAVAGLTTGVAALVLLPVGGVLLTVRRRRDLTFTDVAPGVVPLDRTSAAVRPVRKDPPVQLRVTPPDGLTVGEVGALVSKQLRSRDVTASIIDLAVRGYLRIEEVCSTDGTDAGRPLAGSTDPDDWRLVEVEKDRTGLAPHEARLLTGLFKLSRTPTMSSLADKFAGDLTDVLTAVDERLRERELMNHPLGREKTSIPAFRQRTALGRAFYEQARGFEHYLSTAAEGQLQMEEAHRLISSNLPYAIVFDLVDRWAERFAELEPSESWLGEDGWYRSFDGSVLRFGLVSQSIGRFSATTNETLSATPASESTSSSGGSGFSGPSSSFSIGGGGGGGSRGL